MFNVTFRASCCGARLSRAQVPAFVGSSVRDRKEGRKEMFYLTMHSTHFIYGYMASDIWLRTILIVKNETRCCHMGYSIRLTARVLLHAPSHRQDNTHHGGATDPDLITLQTHSGLEPVPRCKPIF